MKVPIACQLETDHPIHIRRQNLVLSNKKKKQTCQLVDIAIQKDQNEFF